MFFPLNPHCSELDPALFGLTLRYRAEPCTGNVTAEGELVRRSGLRGFQVSFPASTTVVLEYEAVLHYNGLDIETVSSLTDMMCEIVPGQSHNENEVEAGNLPYLVYS